MKIKDMDELQIFASSLLFTLFIFIPGVTVWFYLFTRFVTLLFGGDK